MKSTHDPHLKVLTVFALCALLLPLGWTALQAGGPLLLESPGVPYAWGGTPPTAVIYPDGGSLGHLSSEQALADLLAAAQSWTDVPSASIVIQNGGIIDTIQGPEGSGDLAVENVIPFLAANNKGITPIIFDNEDVDGNGNGDIFDLIGLPPGVLGLATPEFAQGTVITEGWMLLNGLAVDPEDADGISFQGIMTHELGHLLNLAHSVVNGQALFFSGSDLVFPDGTPMLVQAQDIETMYPFSDPLAGGFGTYQNTPHRDDIAILSTLYPEPAMPLESLGTIRGTLLSSVGEPLTGGQIIARNFDANPFEDAVSAISGDFLQDIVADPLLGVYTLNALTPGGRYSLEVRDTVAGGFSTPVFSSPDQFIFGLGTLPGPEEFYSGPAESNSDDPEAAPFLIDITAGGPAAPAAADLILNTFGPPANDTCSGAVDVVASSLPFSRQLNTQGALSEAGEPVDQCGFGDDSNSVWYRFSNDSGSQGSFLVSTAGSEYDTVMQVFSGSCASLQPEVCNDDGGPGLTSQLAIDAQPGEVFWIKVTDYDPDPGGGLLNFTIEEAVMPANDDCADAVVIDLQNLPFMSEVNTRAAGNEAGEAPNSCQFVSPPPNPATVNTVWYAFTNNGLDPLLLQANTVGSNFDTVLQVYSGQCGGLTPVVCNDDESLENGILTSDLSFAAEPGRSYLLKASGFSGGGNLVLLLKEAPPPPVNDDCAAAIELTRNDLPFVDERITSAAGNEDGEPVTTCGSFLKPTQSNSVWYTFVNDSQLPIDLHLSTRGSDYATVLQVYQGACGGFTPLACDDNGGPSIAGELDLTVEAGARIWAKVAEFGQPGGGRLVFSVNSESAAAGIVALNLQSSRQTLTARSRLNYSAAVKNNSAEPVSGVVLTNVLSKGSRLSDLPDGCSADGSTLSCQIGTLAPGEETVSNWSASPLFIGNLSLTASADWDQADPEDPQTSATLVAAVDPLLVFPVSLESSSPLALAAARTGPAGISQDGFVGVAVVNPESVSDDFAFEGTDAEGNDTYISDPAGNLPARGKIERVAGPDEFPGLTADTLTLLARGENNMLRGFFMAGRNDLSQLDGVGGPLPARRYLVFPVARQTASDSTRLFLFNPSDGAQLALSLKDADGNEAQQVTTALPASGTLSATLEEIFGSGMQIADGYVEVRSDAPLQGFEFHSTPQAVEAFAAQGDQVAAELFAPHFFIDDQGNETDLRLISLDGVPMDVFVTAFDNNGDILSEAMVSLAPGRLLVQDVRSLLNLSPGPDGMLTGFLRLEPIAADSIGPFFPLAHLFGAVTFRFNGNSVLSSLPMSSVGAQQWEFYQVADSDSVGMFTGLAILNTRPPVFRQPAQVRVEAFDSQGNLSGQVDIEVDSASRVLGLLHEDVFFGADFSQVGGHIRVTSDDPVVVFALFGDYSQRFLAAIGGQNP